MGFALPHCNLTLQVALNLRLADRLQPRGANFAGARAWSPARRHRWRNAADSHSHFSDAAW